MIEVFPFTKMTYRSPRLQEKWEPIRRRISQCVNFAEYEMVRRGYRKCDVYDFSPRSMMTRLRKVGGDGLIFIPVLISRTYGGYGHKHYVVDKFDDDTFVYGCIARNKEDAIRFHDAGVTHLSQRFKQWNPEEMNPRGIDHDVTGELLGYPKCDRLFFENVWLKDGCLDPMFEMALNTENHELVSQNHVKVSGHPILNRLARYWGFNLIPFFAHSFDCEEAQVFGNKFHELMRERDEEAADMCYELLNMPMVWSLSNCVIELQHPVFWGSANGYYRKEKVVVEWFPM